MTTQSCFDIERGRDAGGTTDGAVPVQSRMNAYWSRWAEQYDSHQSLSRRDPDAESVWKRIWDEPLAAVAGARGSSAQGEAGQRPLDVLDVGTGSGNVALSIARLGHDVTGIDLADGMLRTARAKLDREGTGPGAVRFMSGDAVAPPFPEASFDAIVSRYVLWTLRDVPAALAAWGRLLRPGGIVVAVDSAWFPEGSEIGDGLEDHRREDFRAAYGHGALQRLALSTGQSEEVVSAFRAQGFESVVAEPLEDLLAVDLRDGVAPGHRPQLQHRYVAWKGASAV